MAFTLFDTFSARFWSCGGETNVRPQACVRHNHKKIKWKKRKKKQSWRQHRDKIKFLSSNNPWNSCWVTLPVALPPSGKLTYFLIQIRSVFAGILLTSFITHKQYHGEINTQKGAKVYLLDHFLDKFVGSFKVFWVRAIQQAGQHLTETVESERTQLINPKRISQRLRNRVLLISTEMSSDRYIL